MKVDFNQVFVSHRQQTIPFEVFGKISLIASSSRCSPSIKSCVSYRNSIIFSPFCPLGGQWPIIFFNIHRKNIFRNKRTKIGYSGSESAFLFPLLCVAPPQTPAKSQSAHFCWMRFDPQYLTSGKTYSILIYNCKFCPAAKTRQSD